MFAPACDLELPGAQNACFGGIRSRVIRIYVCPEIFALKAEDVAIPGTRIPLQVRCHGRPSQRPQARICAAERQVAAIPAAAVR